MIHSIFDRPAKHNVWRSVFFKHKKPKKRRMVSGLLGLLAMLFMAATFVVGVVWTIARALFNVAFKPNSQAWKKMVEAMRARLQSKAVGNLIPWDGEMLSLLSLNKINLRKPGWFDNISEGTLTTIYHEPVVAYVGRLGQKNGLLIARTKDKEFIFNIKEKETEMWLNGQPLGLLTGGALLAPGRGSHLLAQVEEKQDENLFPVILGNKTAAAIANPTRTDSPNPRAVTLLRNLNAEEENVVLALTVLKAVTQPTG
jgi:hypothetical protein